MKILLILLFLQICYCTEYNVTFHSPFLAIVNDKEVLFDRTDRHTEIWYDDYLLYQYYDEIKYYHKGNQISLDDRTACLDSQNVINDNIITIDVDESNQHHVELLYLLYKMYIDKEIYFRNQIIDMCSQPFKNVTFTNKKDVASYDSLVRLEIDGTECSGFNYNTNGYYPKFLVRYEDDKYQVENYDSVLSQGKINNDTVTIHYNDKSHDDLVINHINKRKQLVNKSINNYKFMIPIILISVTSIMIYNYLFDTLSLFVGLIT